MSVPTLKLVGHSSDVDAKGVASKFMDVTPALAQEWLERNTSNRSISDARVAQYAEAMKRGEWRVTHQGIAFGKDGQLFDGQHRLWAILNSGSTVTLMVTTGLEPEARTNIDGQRVRSVADNISIVRGEVGVKRLVEIANVIQSIITGEASFKGSYDQTTAILEKYRPDIEWAAMLSGRAKTQLGAASVRGALAFAHKTSPIKVDEFAVAMFSGVGLAEGDPAHTLRELILSGRARLTGSNRRILILKVLRAIYAHIHDQRLRGLFATEDVVAYFGRAHGVKTTANRDGRDPEKYLNRNTGRRTKGAAK